MAEIELDENFYLWKLAENFLNENLRIKIKRIWKFTKQNLNLKKVLVLKIGRNWTWWDFYLGKLAEKFFNENLRMKIERKWKFPNENWDLKKVWCKKLVENDLDEPFAKEN